MVLYQIKKDKIFISDPACGLLEYSKQDFLKHWIGNFANEFAGISCTGVGEDIVSGALAAKIVTRVTDGFSLKDACDKSFSELKSFDGFAGVIGISSKGEIYHCDSHPYMVWASFDGNLQLFN